jgi:hypothetical protein
MICQSINIVTPAATSDPNLGIRNPIERVSVDFLNATWPSATGSGVPKYYAIMGAPTLSSTITAGPLNIMFGPFPDAAYTAEIIGTVRPSPLSATNPTTFLSTTMPDLFLAASMVWGFGYQRDFGAQADDPATAQSWEHQYESLRIGIDVEEMRKNRFVSWSSYHPTRLPTRNGARRQCPHFIGCNGRRGSTRRAPGRRTAPGGLPAISFAGATGCSRRWRVGSGCLKRALSRSSGRSMLTRI